MRAAWMLVALVLLAGCSQAPAPEPEIEPVTDDVEPRMHVRHVTLAAPELASCPQENWCSTLNANYADPVTAAHNESVTAIRLTMTADPATGGGDLYARISCAGPCQGFTLSEVRGPSPLEFTWEGNATQNSSFRVHGAWTRAIPHGQMTGDAWTLEADFDVWTWGPAEKQSSGPNRPR